MDGTGELLVHEDKQRINNLEAAVAYATRELKSLLHDRPPGRTINAVLLAVVRRLDDVAPDPDVVATGERFCEHCSPDGTCGVCGGTKR